MDDIDARAMVEMDARSELRVPRSQKGVLTNKQIITTKRTQLPKDSTNPNPKN